jgi:hypothetical protein
MTLVLNETLSTEVNQPGDAFTATLRHPVLDSDGNVVIPAGAVVRGQITQVQKSGRVGETAVMNLAFSSVSFNGKTYPLNASVQQANPERQTRQTTGEQVGKAAAGAAAGAILGRILGKDTKSTVKGAVIGAAAGTAIAMGPADVDAVLPAGSEREIQMLEIKHEIQKKVTTEIDQQQRDYNLRQQMKVLQDELGYDTPDKEIESLRKRGEGKKWSK